MIRKQNENKLFFENKKYKLLGVVKNAHKNFTISFSPFYTLKETTLKFLFIDVDNYLIPFNVCKIQEKNGSEFIISFARMNNFFINIIRNRRVYIEEKDFGKVLFPKDDYADLINYNVFNEERLFLGKVSQIEGSQLQKYIKIKKEKDEDICIPIADVFINKIDDKKKEIILRNYSKILL